MCLHIISAIIMPEIQSFLFLITIYHQMSRIILILGNPLIRAYFGESSSIFNWIKYSKVNN